MGEWRYRAIHFEYRQQVEFSGRFTFPASFTPPGDSGFTQCRCLSVNINCLLTENILDFLQYLQEHSVSTLQDLSPLPVASKCAKQSHPLITVLPRLTTEVRSKKYVVRRFHRCANVIECTYTKLDSQAYYTPRLYGIAYCSQATNLYSMLLY